MKGCRKILVVANSSIDAFKRCLRLISDEPAWVTVVKVVPNFEGDLHLTGIRNIKDVLDAASEAEVTEISEAVLAERMPAKIRVIKGDILAEVRRLAEEERCDLIVLGRGKNHWLKDFFERKVLKKLINIAQCPVCVVNC